MSCVASWESVLLCFKVWSLCLLQEQAIVEEVLRTILGSPKLKEEHRGILQALQGPCGTTLPDLLMTVTEMCLTIDEDQAQEMKVARQQLEQAAEVSSAYPLSMPKRC